MVRTASVTYEEVAEAAQTVLLSGRKPTIAAVKEHLGDRASPAMIGQFLKTWKTQAVSSNEQGTQDLLSQIAPVPEKTFEPVLRGVEMVEVPAIQVPPVLPEPLVLTPTKPEQPAQSQERTHREHPRSHHKQRNGHQRQQQHRTPREDGEGEREGEPADLLDQASSAFGDYYQVKNLDSLDEQTLRVHLRTLETCLNKEQSRRDAAEKMAHQAMEYAEVLKAQIAQRINDIRQLMEEQIQRLQSEIVFVREKAEQDLLYYREQLNKANHKIMQLQCQSDRE